MYRFVVRVQAATIFSFCFAWDTLNPDYGPYYEAYENNPQKTENQIEVAENFTQFLQRNNDAIKKSYNPIVFDPSQGTWYRIEENYNRRKIPVQTTTFPTLGTEKYLEYDIDESQFTTEIPLVTTENTIFPKMTRFSTYTLATEEFQVLKVIEESEPIQPILPIAIEPEPSLLIRSDIDLPMPIRRDMPIVKTEIDFTVNNRNQTEKSIIEPHEELIDFQNILGRNLSDQGSPISKDKETGVNATTIKTITENLFSLNEIIERNKVPLTLENIIDSKVIVNDTPHNTGPIDNGTKTQDIRQKNVTETNKLLKITTRRDQKEEKNTTIAENKNTPIEVSSEDTLKFDRILNHENQIIDILQRQTGLLEQVAKVLESKEEKGAIRTKESAKDFEDILQELNKKRAKISKNTNMTQIADDNAKNKMKLMSPIKMMTTPTSTQRRMLPTVKTVIDETEVRRALSSDPYVRRILKMAKRKRTKYLQNAA